MKEQLEEIRSRAMAELGDETTREQIENVRVRVLGRAGELTSIMRSMRDVPASERPAMGQLVNQIKSEIEARITELLERMLGIFVSLGFEVIHTQDIEDDFHNFAALNFPPGHPAREMQDSFFLEGGLLLRTHTSNGQIHVMEKRRPPLAVICPGVCYRRDELSVRAAPM